MRPSLAAIFAGGQSRRFGSSKAVARVGGIPIVLRVRTALEDAGSEVAVAGDEDLATAISLPNLSDPLPARGPLGGLHAALNWAHSRSAPGVLCVACDMPFLSSPLLRYLIDQGESGSADVVVPRTTEAERLQPLCAWYSVSCAPEVGRRLSISGAPNGLKDLLKELSVNEIAESEVKLFGDPAMLFMNVNTPGDLARAEALIER